jgi:glutathione S-transferase
MSSSSDRPSGLIAKSGIELLTWGTPNGHKACIMLEELKAAYGKDYVWQGINIGENVQKEPWFTKYSPNGRIPAIVDHDRNDFAVFEGLAILSYMTKHYDPEHKFSFADPDDASRAEQWMAWQHGGLVSCSSAEEGEEGILANDMIVGTNARTSQPLLPPRKRAHSVPHSTLRR